MESYWIYAQIDYEGNTLRDNFGHKGLEVEKVVTVKEVGHEVKYGFQDFIF